MVETMTDSVMKSFEVSGCDGICLSKASGLFTNGSDRVSAGACIN